MKRIQNLLMLLSVIFLSMSCKKDKKYDPQPANALFTLDLNTDYMGANKIDSIVAIWTSGGKQQKVNIPLNGDKLTLPLSTFTEGQGKLRIELFSNMKFVYYKSLWLYEKELIIYHQEALNISGPANFNDNNWLPRVQLKNTPMKIDALIGLRPSDPYFFIKDAEKNSRKVVVAREYWKTKQGVNQVGGGAWQCQSGCMNETGDILNTDYFKFLPQQIGERTWNHIQIIILYEMDKNGGGYSLDMNYTLPE